MVSRLVFVITAWNRDHLAGFARAISDVARSTRTVAVKPEYQGRDYLQFVLHTSGNAYPFYLHLDASFDLFDKALEWYRI